MAWRRSHTIFPEPAGFVLAGDTGRDGYALLIDSASDENREADYVFELTVTEKGGVVTVTEDAANIGAP
jgi:hypothetical protein